MTTELKPIEIYSEFRSQLKELKEFNDSLTFDYEDGEDNKAARSHIYKLKQTRAALDKARKAEKAASLEYGRRVDSEAKGIAEQITAMIDVHQVPIDEVEQRDNARKAVHEERLAQLRALGTPTNERRWSDQLRASLEDAKELAALDWEEYADLAEVAAANTIGALGIAIALAVDVEAKDAELEQLRKEAAEREALDAEREAKEAAEKEARAQAERDKQARIEDNERKARQAKEVGENARRVKQEREEREERIRKETEARLKREAAAEAARKEKAEERRKANAKHVTKTKAEASKALVLAAEIDTVLADKLVELIAADAIAHVELKL